MFLKGQYQVELITLKQIKITSKVGIKTVEFEDKTLKINKVEDYYLIKLKKALNLQQENFIVINNHHEQLITNTLVTTTNDFDKKYATDKALGSIYTKDNTLFRLWAPVATEVILKIKTNQDYILYNLKPTGSEYEILLNGDYDGCEYLYIVRVNGQYNEVVDPYAYSISKNCKTAYVIDLDKVKKNHNYIKTNPQKTIIYETSIADFTNDSNNYFKSPGTYLGLNEPNVVNKQGDAIGIDYVVDMGYTHLQLMPFYYFKSINETIKSKTNYNWGYDPMHYNVASGCFLKNNTPYARIKEPQTMITNIKDNNIAVIMDIVYNHVYDADTFNFEQITPNYYFRFDGDVRANGSYCGNEVASERKMVQRYIIDTCRTWVQLYGVDGFRVDLMGLMDIKTINKLDKEMKKINQNFIMYGEGWNLEPQLPTNDQANQHNGLKIPTIGTFNDDLRDYLKEVIAEGVDYKNSHEYLTLLKGEYSDKLKKCKSPNQIVNYLSCHDDHTLYDWFLLNGDQNKIDEYIKLAYEELFLAKGMILIHSGCDFLRTKDLKKNTYNDTIEVNAIKWDNVSNNQELIKLIKGLISTKLK